MNWLDRVFVYCALAITESLEDAQELLSERGVKVTNKQLEGFACRGTRYIDEVSKRALPAMIFGFASFDIADRLNRLALRIEAKLASTDWNEKTDVDLVAKYLSVMAALADLEKARKAESTNNANNATESAGYRAERERQFEEVFKTLEHTEDRDTIKDAIRHIAAATGAAVLASEPE